VTRTIDAALVLAAWAIGCGGARKEEPLVGITLPSSDEAAVVYRFDSLDDRAVDSSSLRGKPTVIAFESTGSLKGQAQVNYLVAMAKHDAEKVNYVLVALEPQGNRQLVEEYRRFLGVTFPCAMADDETLQGAGPFGDVRSESTTFILDRRGRVVFKAEARVAKADELRAELAGL
jgi:hypothetical protein